jgi:tetratricopeptide (TPR) repeat protein
MKLDTGLFRLDFEDHHAVLGISITADAKVVGKRYLAIEQAVTSLADKQHEMKRAQEFEVDRDYGRAVLEMREALKTYPNSAKGHSYLASLYLKAGQTTLAKIHAKRALDLLSEDEVAQAVQAKLEKGSAGGGKGTAGKSAAKSAAKRKPEDKGGGFFGGLFGGKKK